MARKIVKSEVFEINTSSMSKPRKILYNKIIKGTSNNQLSRTLF